ncbi:uncharacterized protein UHOD_01368 [Ustilago sp. UG-2017b]|nr:uncharacterized protein UHOD_01368 [Ustilago sp. UG-2017b]
MPAKTKGGSKTTAVSSPDHLHPSSAAASPKTKSNTAAGSSSSSSTTSTVNGSTHIPVKVSHPVSPFDTAHNSWTWNPIRIIERKLFRAYWNVEATFVLSMLEAWEVFLVIMVFLTLTLLLWYSAYHYFPRHAREVTTRALYYVYGNSPPPQLAAAVTTNATSVSAASGSTASAAVTAGEGVLEKLIAQSNQLWASLNAEKSAKEPNSEVVDTLINNLNKVKQMISNAGATGKAEL